MSPPSRLSLSPDLSSDDEDYSTIRNGRRKGKEPSANDEDAIDGGRDYAAHMDEIFSDDEDDKATLHESDERQESAESDDDEGFVYTGVDAEPSASGYRAQLADVLDGEQLSSDEESTEAAPDHSVTDVASPRSGETHSLTSADDSREVSVRSISHGFNVTEACLPHEDECKFTECSFSQRRPCSHHRNFQYARSAQR